MAYKMKGFGGFGNPAPAKQIEIKSDTTKPRDPEKPFTQEELLKRVGGVRTKKSPAKHTSKWGAHTHARFDRNETHEHSARYPSTEKKKKKKNKKGTVVSRNIKKLGKWVSGIRIKGGRKRVGYGPKAW